MRRPLLLLLTCLPGVGLCHAQHYSPADILQWPERSFAAATRYQLDPLDGSPLLRADCSDRQASARYLEQQIDLRQTPVLRWSCACTICACTICACRMLLHIALRSATFPVRP